MKTISKTWKEVHLTRIDHVKNTYSSRAQKIIQPNYIREVVEQLSKKQLNEEHFRELNERMDKLYYAIPNINETSPNSYKTYRSLLDDFKYFVNTELNLLPRHYYKSIYIPIGVAGGLLFGLLFGLYISNPHVGYLTGFISGAMLGYIIGYYKDVNHGINKRFA